MADRPQDLEFGLAPRSTDHVGCSPGHLDWHLGVRLPPEEGDGGLQRLSCGS